MIRPPLKVAPSPIFDWRFPLTHLRRWVHVSVDFDRVFFLFVWWTISRGFSFKKLKKKLNRPTVPGCRSHWFAPTGRGVLFFCFRQKIRKQKKNDTIGRPQKVERRGRATKNKRTTTARQGRLLVRFFFSPKKTVSLFLVEEMEVFFVCFFFTKSNRNRDTRIDRSTALIGNYRSA